MAKEKTQLGLFNGANQNRPENQRTKRGELVPITPSVLAWAIEESGYNATELIARLGVASAVFNTWLKGQAQPNLSQVRKLSAVLKRPRAVFLLPHPPQRAHPQVEFRGAVQTHRTQLNVEELRFLRQASRIQRGLSWVLSELGGRPQPVPRADASSDPEVVAKQVRSRLGVPEEKQLAWKTSAEALAVWRSALEASGVFVFVLPIGKSSCRGFSLSDQRAPLIAVNTSWNHEARIFTLFHEYGHLLTRTNSACLEGDRPPRMSGYDSIERWCERFSASILMPWGSVVQVLESEWSWRPGKVISELSTVSGLARRFKVSLRAAALRLIQREIADRRLYERIPPVADEKRGGGGGKGRSRCQTREDQYGERTTGIFLSALTNEVLSRADVLDYLDLSDHDIDQLASSTMSL